ncbi:FtsX-like permease family protein [Antrihabitans cavernicola]|uniref:ABC transporter permease n=1 Tax=Antrihabitans cavernicola TaxID=2495913 RepID=A0A5A7SFF6_9NOCA|nr:ABC transporter permease [Spelaeibacter cavernicola]KAA0024860.1 ABC transporter permease [Spelaeibacter cavernicola]
MKSALDRLRLFSLREFAEHRGRTLASMAVVAVSAALLVAVLAIIGSINHSIDSLSTGIAGNAALEVSGVADGGFPAAVADDVATVPGVQAAVPLVQTTVRTESGPTLLIGADARSAALESDVKGALQSQAGALLKVPNGVLVGPDTGYAEGQTFDLQDTKVTVAAVLSGEGFEQLNGGHYVLAPLQLAQSATGRANSYDSILIVAKPGTDSDALQSGVTDAVAGRANVTESSGASAKSGNGVLLIQFVALSSAAMAFMVSGFLIYTAMGMAIAQRRPVISMLRAMGGYRTTILRDTLGEAAVLGLIGGAIGSALGVLMGRVAIERLPVLFMQSVSARIDYVLPWWTIPVAIVVSVLVSVAAAALCARQVYKVSPIEALAPVGVSTADTISPRLRIAAGVIAVVLGVAAVLAATAPLGIASNMGISLLFGAEIVLGFAIGPWLVRGAARVAGLFGGPGALAAATIERAPKRVWATLMTVTIAVAATLALNAGNANAVDSTKDSFAPLGKADVWVSNAAPGNFPTGPQLPQDLTTKVSALPGVAKVVEGQAGYVSLGGNKVMMYGLDSGAYSPLLESVDSQAQQRMFAGGGVVLSRDLARTLKVDVGDQLTLQTAHGPKTTTVLATTRFFSALNGAVALPLSQMRDWFDRPGSTTLQITATPGTDSGALLSTIRGLVPGGVEVYSGAAAVEGFGQTLSQATNLDNTLWIIVILISAVALLNTLLLSVLERRRELGVLRAIGSSRRFSLRMILAEAAGIGIVGALLGLVFGYAQQFVADFASSQAWNVDVKFEPTIASIVLAVCAMLLCLVGALPPAYKAARMNIIDALGVE